MQNIAVSLLYFDILLYHSAKKMTMQLAIKFSNRIKKSLTLPYWIFIFLLTPQETEAFLHHEPDVDIAFPLPCTPIFDRAVRYAETLREFTI